MAKDLSAEKKSEHVAMRGSVASDCFLSHPMERLTQVNKTE